jgi:hypothetical protein
MYQVKRTFGSIESKGGEGNEYEKNKKEKPKVITRKGGEKKKLTTAKKKHLLYSHKKIQKHRNMNCTC